MQLDSKREFIKNRKGQKMAVLAEIVPNQRGLAFVMHGLGGFKEQPQIIGFAEAFQENGYTTVRFDTTNTFGESDGKYEDATITNYYEDLEDVIAWAASQLWYQEPFCLIGHSFGGICPTLYAERYPKKVKGLAPIATVISGKLSIEATPKEELAKWKETGWRVRHSFSKGIEIRLKWSHMIDRLKYDILPEAHKLTMPVLLIVGENDSSTPRAHQKLLYDKLPGPKEFHIIKDNEHTFYEAKKIQEVKAIIDKWIKRNL